MRSLAEISMLQTEFNIRLSPQECFLRHHRGVLGASWSLPAVEADTYLVTLLSLTRGACRPAAKTYESSIGRSVVSSQF